MENSFKVLGSAIIVAIAAFAYVYGRARGKKKDLVEYTRINILSYEYLVDDLKTLISRDKEKFSGKNLKLQIHSREMVKKMSDFLLNEGVQFDLIEEDCIGLILLSNNAPVYMKLYSYKSLAQDLLDVLPEKGIYEQEIEL